MLPGMLILLVVFFVGQCTYWANIHYHGLTGWWVEWLGNADAWVGGAASAGWITSSEPNPNGPSIIVLQPYTEGAGAYGHVGVVESGVSAASANANGVSVSSMNWNGGWDQVSYWTFHPGAGVSFIWHP
ncbi:CHAP domain-containing protein [Dictyobacter formicarum]|uniref:CHAP domain-containing protein n=1 Tax=Dictyobacter formicarum TaxID=2778368 RepID=UPI003570DF9B